MTLQQYFTYILITLISIIKCSSICDHLKFVLNKLIMVGNTSFNKK